MKLHRTFFFISTLFICCDNGDDNQEVVLPANLSFTVNISEDGSGKVNLEAVADNTNYFNVHFGETPNETPIKTTDGKASFTYSKSGVYTISVAAHATETAFINSTKEVTITLKVSEDKIIWQDEFDGSSLNENFWTYETGGGGWGNNELQYYRSENTSVQNGLLTITAKKEDFSGSSYTSSRLITKGKKEFQYGRIEIRAKLPKGQGIWPALWMLGGNISSVAWPKCGEIDIMEMIGGGSREKTIYGTLHWDDNGHACTCDKPGYTLPSGIFNDDFHIFSMTWDQSNIKWYVDGTLFNTINITPAGLSEFHAKYFFIFNVAVGGNWPGNPDNTTTFPQQMIVDYVRVYEQ